MSREQKKIARYWALFLTVSMVVFTLALQGCFLDDDDDPVATGGDTTGAASELVIAAAGGTVASTSGTLNGTQIIIPANALAADTTITIEESTVTAPAGTATVGIVVAFGPTGTNFATPATITVPYDLADVTAAGKTPNDIVLYTSDGQTATVVAGPYTIDQGAETVSASIDGFSLFWTAVTTGGDGGGGVTEVTNVFMDGIIGDLDYYFIHGSTNTARDKFLVTLNDNVTSGTSHLYVLDADSVAAGTPALAGSGTTYATVTGDGSGPLGATITFRSSWTPDDSKILLSGADRFYVINASTLAVENGAEGDTTIAGQNHDALPTSDGKYALLTLRTLPYSGDTATNKDGEIQLYDVVNGAPIGNSVSVCNGCHGDERMAVLCGLDGTITDDGDGTYSGTVYVAGHGAHFAKVTLDIDPSNTTDPIAALVNYNTINRIQVAPAGSPASDYLLHDARIDGDTMYWSTYKKDQYGYLHYGAVELTNGTVTADISYAPDCRATSGSSFYCASGQTDTHYMPITMTNEGYITVIPKADITGTALLTDAPAACPIPGVTEPTNVFMDGIIGDLDYYFIHGSTSADRSKFLVTLNDNVTSGTSHLYVLDADSVAGGVPALAGSGITNATVTGDGSGPLGATITFRSSWTPDDSKILLSGADRFYVINADTLAVENGTEGDTTIAGQNHDALPTSDGKYALLTLRTLPYSGDTATNKDGEIQLYDVVNGAPIGNSVSVCNGCHGDERMAVLCGLDGELTLVSGNPGTAPGYADKTPDTYQGTVYVAGHGAHFAKVTLTIDPSNTTDPITALVNYNTLNRVQVAPGGSPASDYLLHDARIDGNTMYWSTYKKDQYGYLHYGAVDLSSGTVTADISYAPDCRVTSGSSFYCASGQTDTHYMPITMTNEGYITVIPKTDITGTALLTDAPAPCPEPSYTGVTETTNVFMDGIIGDLDYYFIHGSTNTARDKFLVTFNDNVTSGTSHLYMMNADSIAANDPALATYPSTTHATVTGDGSGPLGATITFRSSWTPDDSKIFLSGADRFYVLNADTLAVENGAEGDTTIAGQNHDALSTSDGKYALLTLRTLPYSGDTASNKDGEIQLYDVENGAPIGNSVSVCNGCHGDERMAVLCGLDGTITDDGDGTYSGTVYVAGHGAHFAKVTLDVDPSNTTDPIAALVNYNTLHRIQVAPGGSPASDYLLHDARIDGDTMYWSTYKLDQYGMLHYGKVDLINGTVTVDISYDPDVRATSGTSYYCASGQTDTHFMPITMTNEGYISVIPKSTIIVE